MDQSKKKRKTRRGRECASVGCTNTEYLRDATASGISFFKFPTKPSVRFRWCNLIKRQHGRDGFFVSRNTVICEKHFRPEEIYRPPGGTRSRLREGAEPSIFNWSKDDTTRKVRAPPKSINVLEIAKKENIPVVTSGVLVTETVQDLPDSPGDSFLAEIDNMDFSESFIESCPSPEKEDKSTQTDWPFDFCQPELSSVYNDHNYPFVFMSVPPNPVDYQKSIEERLEVQSEIIENLKSKVGLLQKELDLYKEREFTLEQLKDDDSAIQFYTGFPSYDALLCFFEYIQPKIAKLQYWNSRDLPDSQAYQEEGKKKPGPTRSIPQITEFFMVLIRLKVGLFVKDIANRFGISMGQFSKIFCTWINFLYFELKQIFPFPTQEQVRRNIPEQFALFPTTRIIIDCTEIFVEVPSSMLAQSQTWSNYKHHNTFKVLVGITPNGQVTFVSKLWGGRVSDKYITQHSGLCNLLEAGDNIMADRGFEISDILPQGCHLNIPPFKGSREQLSSEEVQQTVHIASVRIHVERAIGRIKNFHVLDGTLPLSLAHIANQIFSVCAYLTNFMPPLLQPHVEE